MQHTCINNKQTIKAPRNLKKQQIDEMASLALAKLVNRKLIRITGPDCYPYLQSLFSNDLRLLYEPDRIKPSQHALASSNVLSSFMLNARGRTICDILVYRTPNTKYTCAFTPPGQATENDELLIECDATLASGLANTLYGYRVRRKVALEILGSQSVWCAFPIIKNNLIDTFAGRPITETSIIKTKNVLANTKELLSDQLTIVNDPRVDMLGLRILVQDANSNNDSSSSKDDLEFNQLKQSLQSQIDLNITRASQKDYTLHRYLLGVGEGQLDHPDGGCLPLECNADLLNSVSFDKGCYLGQELTARIHFTGVVRKRLMPIVIHKATKQQDVMPYAKDSEILSKSGDTSKKVGTLRNQVGGYGLALLRHDLIDETTELVHEGTLTKISTWKPYWWRHEHPVEAQ